MRVSGADGRRAPLAFVRRVGCGRIMAKFPPGIGKTRRLLAGRQPERQEAQCAPSQRCLFALRRGASEKYYGSYSPFSDVKKSHRLCVEGATVIFRLERENWT